MLIGEVGYWDWVIKGIKEEGLKPKHKIPFRSWRLIGSPKVGRKGPGRRSLGYFLLRGPIF